MKKGKNSRLLILIYYKELDGPLMEEVTRKDLNVQQGQEVWDIPQAGQLLCSF
jgi:hypothetical protein